MGREASSGSSPLPEHLKRLAKGRLSHWPSGDPRQPVVVSQASRRPPAAIRASLVDVLIRAGGAQIQVRGGDGSSL